MTETKKPDHKQAFIDARDAIRQQLDAVDAEGKRPANFALEITSAQLRALMRGIPPEPELPDSFCSFDASYVPFLRHGDAEHTAFYGTGGIVVTPHPDGGAVLSCTNGSIMMLAYDKTAKVSPQGVRLAVPKAALDACEIPEPINMVGAGYLYPVPTPEWRQADRVLSIGASFLVVPKAQPPGIPDDSEDGVMLFSDGIETGSHWHKDDCRRLDVGSRRRWQTVFDLWMRADEAASPALRVTPQAATQVAAAIKAAGEGVWRVDVRAGVQMFVPEWRSDIVIFIGVPNPAEIDVSLDWLYTAALAAKADAARADAEPPATPAASAETPAGEG